MEQSLLFNALIYLAAAVAAVPIAKRLGLGAVLGYLLAGMAIGPWGLRLIDNVEDILHFSEFGVVLLLFMIGLELDPKRLWSLRRSIFGWGTAQVVTVSLALFGAAVSVGVDWNTAFIAALGMSLVHRHRAGHHQRAQAERHVRRPASILLFQDIAAIPMIAISRCFGLLGPRQRRGLIGGLKVVAVIATDPLRPLSDPASDAYDCPAPDCAKYSPPALLLAIAIGLLMERSACRWPWQLPGRRASRFEYRHALKPIWNRSKACCWDCSSYRHVWSISVCC